VNWNHVLPLAAAAAVPLVWSVVVWTAAALL